MSTKTYIFFVGLLLICGVAIAQNGANSPYKLGIKTSINLSTMLGSELENPRPKYGYTAGAYLIKQNKKNWTYYAEAVASFRGARFNNGDTGYSKIASFYVDAAFLPTYKPNDNSSVSFGPYGSFLGLSSLFVGDQRKSELNDIGIAPFDAGLATYYHIHKKLVIYQFGVKVGILDVNDSVNFEGYFPETGKGGSITNLSFEIGLLF